jgi:branched-chain amino acid aminotransferase
MLQPKIVPNPNSRIILQGAGVFTTIRVIYCEPWLWDKHWRRLMHCCERLGIETSDYSEYIVRRGLDESISDADKLKSLKARITITDERPSPLWSHAKATVPSNVTFLVSPARVIKRPFRVGVSPHLINSTSPITGLKTCNYLEPVLSLDDARSRGFQEAIRVNESGRVASACMANVFWLKGDQLFTPHLLTGCLAGTTREFICESLNVNEIAPNLDELRRADAIFLTSAGLGVTQVEEFDGREMPKVEHSILTLVPG